MSELLDAALWYAGKGWKIFPLAPGQKTPLTAHGCKDATSDPVQIRTWWSRHDCANIGLACGPESGVYVIDIDVKDTENGYKSLEEFPPLPETICQETPRGGRHYLYSTGLAVSNRNHFRPGIDIRCDGYYIVLAPSVHPNGGKYAWSLGSAPWERDASEYPDFMRPASKGPWDIQDNHSSKRNCKPAESGREGRIRRASAYLSACDPAIQGEAGHNKLLYAAARLIHGFLLSDSEAFDILAREYNPRCVPPWDFSVQKDDRDFRHKISEARKLQPNHEDGWLLNDDSYSEKENGCHINVDDLLNEFRNDAMDSFAPKPKLKAITPENGGLHQTPLFQGDGYSDAKEYEFLIKPTGLLGGICSWINTTAMKEQPFLSLACSLAFMGALLGRKVKDSLGSRTNLYCMGVAPSSAGKAHAMNQIRRLASESGALSILGGSDLASDSAIEDRVSREPSTLFLWDEIGHLLAHIKSGASPHHAQVVSLLMRLYSSAGSVYLGREYADQERQRTIIQPCCCIYGTSTLERFTGGISPMELQDGWLSRCLVFRAPFDSVKKRGISECDVPLGLIEKVSEWSKRRIPDGDPKKVSTFVGNSNQPKPPGQLIVPTEREADGVFIGFDNESIEFGKRNKLLACLWAKAEENARRIALIVACGECFDSPHITKEVANYSCRLIRYLLNDFGCIIAPDIVEGEINHWKRRLVKIIDRSGVDGMLQCEVTKSSPDMRRNDRIKYLDDLVESGEIAIGEEIRGKSKTKRFWTAENFAKRVTE